MGEGGLVDIRIYRIETSSRDEKLKLIGTHIFTVDVRVLAWDEKAACSRRIKRKIRFQYLRLLLRFGFIIHAPDLK
jgi:hypothetical protein